MKKYIHYCWFGNNPLPKLAKKCIESWKKFLPDYEIICWNEENTDLEECAFVRDAYANKKWAFVADYTRAKAMYEYGGIYFDTDMEVIKPIDDLLEKGTGFLGVEDSHMIACGVWYEPEPKSYLAEKMLEFYRSQEFFDMDNMYKISIPRVISSILKDFDSSNFETQELNHNETIYRRDYFYPLSYNHQYNKFTEKSCMIHYYDASWTPKWEQRENKIFRLLGKEKGQKFIDLVRTTKRRTKKLIKIGLYPAIYVKRRNDLITKDYIDTVNKTLDGIKKTKYDYIAFHNPEWFGVTNATKELFENTVECKELYRKKDLNDITDKLIECGYKKVIFSGFCIGWKDLATILNSKGITVQTYFHGSHSQVLEPYGWARNLEIFELAKKGIVKKMGTCKASLVEYYKSYGCNTVLLTNKVNLKKYKRTRKDDNFVIGIYASKTEIYRKNAFASLAAAKLVKQKNVVVDMVPLTKNARIFARYLGIKITGVEHAIPREELLQRMANCDVLSYVTFTECAPMTPLESFAQGVPCVVGDNCHYFKGEELEKYIVVSDEENPERIAEKIDYAYANKDKVLKLYNDWCKKAEKQTNKLLKEYLEEGEKNEEK